MELDKLAAEFDPAAIHWRVQGTPYIRGGGFSAMALAYIDARDVMDRLDSACGSENWQDKYEVTQGGLIICSIGIRIGDDWVWKSDGAGETAVEGKKGGMSDALKRCAVKWGIGRYLYRLDSPWVPCDVKVKNNKTYWKSWKVDPWSKVKETTYSKAEESRKEPVVTPDQVTSLQELAEQAKVADVYLCREARVDHLADIPASMFEDFKQRLTTKANELEES